MRKKSFLSGISATLAIVALITMVFTSCKKEEFHFEPAEVVPASAVISATVYDSETGQVIDATCTPSQTVTINAEPDGSIATQQVTITASLLPKFVDNSATVTVPALKKGQYAYIPLSIFLLPVSSVVEDFTMTPDPQALVDSDSKEEEIITLTNKEEKEKDMPYIYQAIVGQEVLNLSEIEKKIDALQDVKAMTDLTMDQVKAALKAQLASYDQGFSSKEANGIVAVPSYSIVKVTPVTSYLTTEYTMSAKVNDKEWKISGVQVRKAVGTIATPNQPEYINHGHGHGDNSNAGGGSGGR